MALKKWTMSNFIDSLINIISPKVCVICGSRLMTNEYVFCSKCNVHLPRTGFADNAYDNKMAQLFWGLIPIERCAAFTYYNSGNESREIIHSMKYRNHPEIGRIVGENIAKEFALKGFFVGIDAIVAVPLARKRQQQRGYNQSDEIAFGVSKATKIPIYNNVVRRDLFTESQTNKDRWERADNVNNVFRLLDAKRICGKHILVIDDVVTTGATVCACARELVKAGNVRISVLSLGYTNI